MESANFEEIEKEIATMHANDNKIDISLAWGTSETKYRRILTSLNSLETRLNGLMALKTSVNPFL